MADSLTDIELCRLARSFARRRPKVYFYCPLLSAAMAASDHKAVELIMRVAHEDGVRIKAIDEIILQSHLFLGFPAMIEAARLLAKIRGRRRQSNELPGPYAAADCRHWNQVGMKKIRRFYGHIFERLVNYVNSFSPQILTWMINDGYGQVLSRPGVSFKLRELSAVATLTVTGYENQLRAHIRGTINYGVERALIKTTVSNAGFFCSQTRVNKALEILDSDDLS